MHRRKPGEKTLCAKGRNPWKTIWRNNRHIQISTNKNDSFQWIEFATGQGLLQLKGAMLQDDKVSRDAQQCVFQLLSESVRSESNQVFHQVKPSALFFVLLTWKWHQGLIKGTVHTWLIICNEARSCSLLVAIFWVFLYELLEVVQCFSPCPWRNTD